MKSWFLRSLALAAIASSFALIPASFAQEPSYDSAAELDVPFVPTPEPVVEAMLELAGVGPDDVLYDLGSGDGRIPITAARRWGTRGVGVDLNPERIKEANANAMAAGVQDKVTFVNQDLFETDLHDATVVTLYLLPDVNLRLRPKLLEQLRPGTRVVSHAFSMGDWAPTKEITVDGKTVYLWVIPEKTGRPTAK